jgi:hypothetical protein
MTYTLEEIRWLRAAVDWLDDNRRWTFVDRSQIDKMRHLLGTVHGLVTMGNHTVASDQATQRALEMIQHVTETARSAANDAGFDSTVGRYLK